MLHSNLGLYPYTIQIDLDLALFDLWINALQPKDPSIGVACKLLGVDEQQLRTWICNKKITTVGETLTKPLTKAVVRNTKSCSNDVSTYTHRETYCVCPGCLSVCLSQICFCSVTLQPLKDFSNNFAQMFTTL